MPGSQVTPDRPRRHSSATAHRRAALGRVGKQAGDLPTSQADRPYCRRKHQALSLQDPGRLAGHLCAPHLGPPLGAMRFYTLCTCHSLCLEYLPFLLYLKNIFFEPARVEFHLSTHSILGMLLDTIHHIYCHFCP